MKGVLLFAVAFAALCASAAPSADGPDAQVRAMVKECRELLAADKLDEAVEKVKAAIEVEGAGLRTQGTIYNVYSDVMRKRGDTVAADKSLLKAYDLLLKTKEEKAAKGVAARLAATPDGKALLESYRTKKRAKAEQLRKEEAEVRAAKRAEEAEQRKAAFAAADDDPPDRFATLAAFRCSAASARFAARSSASSLRACSTFSRFFVR